MTDFKNTAWDFTRTIEDRFANTTITATGTMRLSDVQWQEKGEINSNPFFQLSLPCGFLKGTDCVV